MQCINLETLEAILVSILQRRPSLDAVNMCCMCAAYFVQRDHEWVALRIALAGVIAVAAENLEVLQGLVEFLVYGGWLHGGGIIDAIVPALLQALQYAPDIVAQLDVDALFAHCPRASRKLLEGLLTRAPNIVCAMPFVQVQFEKALWSREFVTMAVEAGYLECLAHMPALVAARALAKMAFVQGDTGKATHVGWRLVQASFKDLLTQATRGGPVAFTEMHELSATFCRYAHADHWQQQDELSLSFVVRAAACLDREHVEHGVTNDLRCIACKFVSVASEAMMDTLFGSVQEEAALRLVAWSISENACGLSEHLVAAATRVLRMTGKSYVLWFLDAVLNMVDHFPSARGAVAYLGEALRVARKTNATVDVVCLDFILGAQKPSRKAVANMLVKRHGSPVLVHFLLMQGVCTKAALQRQKVLDNRWSKARHSWCMACMRSRQERH